MNRILLASVIALSVATLPNLADSQQRPTFPTPLMSASRAGDLKQVKVLLTQPQHPVNQQDFNGTAAMHFAAMNGSVPVLKALLAAGAGIDLQNKSGWSPLFYALQQKQNKAAAFLIERGANVNLSSRIQKRPLMIDLEFNGGTQTELLLRKGAEIKVFANSGDSLLHHVARVGKNRRFLGPFIKKGLDVNGQNKSGMTPLMYAALYGNDGIVKELISRGAQVNLQNKKGETALFLAVKTHGRPGRLPCIQILLANHADVNLANSKGISPLQMARDKADVAVVDLLNGSGPKTPTKPTEASAQPSGAVP